MTQTITDDLTGPFSGKDALVLAALTELQANTAGGKGDGPWAAKSRSLANEAGALLGALRMYTELIGMPGVLAGEHRHLAGELRVLSDRSSAMLERLLQVGTVAAAVPARTPRPPEIEATVLPDAVLECLGQLSKLAGRAVTFFCAPSAYFPVAISRPGFEQVVTTLVEKVGRAAPRGDAIAVTLMGMREPGKRDAGMQLVLTVRDRGRGTNSKDPEIPRVGRSAEPDAFCPSGFQPVRELVERSGGVFEMEGDPEQETVVSVSWPTLDPRRARRELPMQKRLGGSGGWGDRAAAKPSVVPVPGTELLARGEA